MTGHDREPVIQATSHGVVRINEDAGVYAVGLDGTLLSINPRFAELFGYAPSAMSGRPIFDFMVEREKDERRAEFARLVGGEVPSLRTDGTYLSADGTEVELVTQSTLSSSEFGTFVIGIVLDGTAQQRVEHGVERVGHALRTVSAANPAMIRAGTEAELLQSLCDLALSTGAYAASYIGYAEHDEQHTVRAVARAGGAIHGLDEIVVRWDDSPQGRGPTRTAIRTGAPAIIRDTSATRRCGLGGAPACEESVR